MKEVSTYKGIPMDGENELPAVIRDGTAYCPLCAARLDMPEGEAMDCECGYTIRYVWYS